MVPETIVTVKSYGLHLINGWELGNEVKVLNFQYAMMCANNVLVMKLCIMDVMVVILLTHKPFPSTCFLPSSCLFSCTVVILRLLWFHCSHIHRKYMFNKSLYLKYFDLIFWVNQPCVKRSHSHFTQPCFIAFANRAQHIFHLLISIVKIK